MDKRLSALDKRSGKKTEKILVNVLVAVACLALGFAVGMGLTSHWVRQQEESALQMRQAGFEHELGEVFITGFKKAVEGDRKTLEKILLTGQRNEGYWKEVFSAIGASAEEKRRRNDPIWTSSSGHQKRRPQQLPRLEYHLLKILVVVSVPNSGIG